MASATSLRPLVDAVYEVLCEGAGRACLITPRTFKRWTGRGPVTEAPPSALRPPNVQVRFGRITPGEHVGRNHDGATQRYEIALDVAYAYEGGNFLGGTGGGDSDSVMAKLASDQALIKFALEEELNLARTSKGLDTGLASGLLDHVETSEPVQINSAEGAPQRIVVTHRFVGDVQLARPT